MFDLDSTFTCADARDRDDAREEAREERRRDGDSARSDLRQETIEEILDCDERHPRLVAAVAFLQSRGFNEWAARLEREKIILADNLLDAAADAAAYKRDIYAYHGVRRSDF